MQMRAAVLVILSLTMAGCTAESKMVKQTAQRASVRPAAARASSARTRARASASSMQKAVVAPAMPTPPAHLRIPILVYHHIRKNQGWGPETWSAKMSVSPAAFEKQMQWLADRGYTTITLDTLVAIADGTMRGPEKPVVITFDDNVLSAYDLAVPVMEKHGQIGVFYLIAGRMDGTGLIDRAKAKDLAKRGMDVQSHTMTHRVLTALPVSQIDWELQESRRMLEELLGTPVRHVAYPGTAHNATVRERARLAGYATATIMDPRPMTQADDRMKLPRIMMIDSTNLEKTLP